LSTCQFITVECRNTGCGDKVLLAKLEDHSKNECLHRLVEFTDCGDEIAYNNDLSVRHKPSPLKYSLVYIGVDLLQAHGNTCPNAVGSCHLCQQEIPSFKVYTCSNNYDYCRVCIHFTVVAR